MNFKLILIGFSYFYVLSSYIMTGFFIARLKHYDLRDFSRSFRQDNFE